MFVKQSVCLGELVRRAAFAVLCSGLRRAEPLRRGDDFCVCDRQAVHICSCLNGVRKAFGEQNPAEVHVACSVPSC